MVETQSIFKIMLKLYGKIMSVYAVMDVIMSA